MTPARTLARIVAGAMLLCGAAAMPAAGQKTAKPDKAEKSDSARKDKYTSSKFWESTAPFDMTISVNMKSLLKDKGDPGPWRAGTVAYVSDSSLKTHPVRLRTRGRSRLKICDRFPPVWVDFAKEDVKGTVLRHLNRFKLVAPCKYSADFERYVIGEYNIYRIHQLFTPVSHRVRLIKLTVKDSASGKEQFTKYAFAVEDIDEVAERLGGKKLPVTGLVNTDLEPRQTAVMGLLQYMIGNTDFSFSGRHNLEFVNMAGVIYPIIFDYDQSGVINTVYSTPDPSLGIQRVTERVYRGLCVPLDTLKAVIAELKAKRPQVEALYSDDNGKLMGTGSANASVKYLAGFYSDMDNERRVQRDIVEKCAVTR
jgi:hypothetical protein